MDVRQSLIRWIDQKSARTEFAQSVGISDSHLSLLLQGKRGCSFDVAKKIEKKTHGDIDAIRLYEEKPIEREVTQ